TVSLPVGVGCIVIVPLTASVMSGAVAVVLAGGRLVLTSTPLALHRITAASMVSARSVLVGTCAGVMLMGMGGAEGGRLTLEVLGTTGIADAGAHGGDEGIVATDAAKVRGLAASLCNVTDHLGDTA